MPPHTTEHGSSTPRSYSPPFRKFPKEDTAALSRRSKHYQRNLVVAPLPTNHKAAASVKVPSPTTVQHSFPRSSPRRKTPGRSGSKHRSKSQPPRKKPGRQPRASPRKPLSNGKVRRGRSSSPTRVAKKMESRGSSTRHSRGSHSTSTGLRQEDDDYDYSSLLEEEYDSPVKMVVCSSTPSYRRKSRRQEDGQLGCVNTGAALKSHLKHCLLLTSDLYDRECTTTKESRVDRGDDDEFFVHDPSVLSGTSAQQYYVPPADDLTEPPSIFNSIRTAEDSALPDASSSSYWKAQVAHAMDLTPTDHPADELSDAPRRPRGSFDEIKYTPPPATEKEASNVPNEESSLRDVRLHIFTEDRQSGTRDTPTYDTPPVEGPDRNRDAIAVKYSRALEDLAGQQESIRALRRELSQAQKELNRRSPTGVPEKEQAAKIFEERIQVEERLRKEVTLNGRLMNRIADLEKETARLTSELEETRESVEVKAWTPKRPSHRRLLSSTSTQASSEYEDLVKAELLSLKAELVELKAQLAEARAARLSAEAARDELEQQNEQQRKDRNQLRIELEQHRSGSGVVELKSQIDAMQTKLKESTNQLMRTEVRGERMVELKVQLEASRAAKIKAEKQKADAEEERDVAIQKATSLQSELNIMLGQITELKHKSESSDAERQKHINRLKEELASMRSEYTFAKDSSSGSLEEKTKLEESLARAQTELGSLRSKYGELEHELLVVQSRAEERERSADEEVEQLKNEVRQAKESLSKTHAEIIQQAAQHLEEKKQLGEELEKSRQAAITLQNRLVTMDDKLAWAENAEERRQLGYEDHDEKKTDTSALRRFSGDVFERLKKKLDTLEK